MQIVDGLGKDVENGTRLPLRDGFAPEDAIQKFSALQQVGHQVHAGLVVIYLVKW